MRRPWPDAPPGIGGRWARPCARRRAATDASRLPVAAPAPPRPRFGGGGAEPKSRRFGFGRAWKGGAACCTREEGAVTARPIATGRPVPGCERGAVAMPSPVKLPSGVSSSGAEAAMPQEVRARGRRRCPRSGAPPFSRCRSLRSGRERSLRAHEECLSFPSVLASLSLGETEEPPYGGGSFARRGCEPVHVMQFGDYPGVKAGRPGIPAPWLSVGPVLGGKGRPLHLPLRRLALPGLAGRRHVSAPRLVRAY